MPSADDMSFGIGLPIVQQVPNQTQAWEATAGAAELLHIARAADRLGFACITCSDHVAVPLEEDASSFSGRFVRWRAVMVSPRPAQRPRPPIWVGGNTDAVARRAG